MFLQIFLSLTQVYLYIIVGIKIELKQKYMSIAVRNDYCPWISDIFFQCREAMTFMSMIDTLAHLQFYVIFLYIIYKIDQKSSVLFINQNTLINYNS